MRAAIWCCAALSIVGTTLPACAATPTTPPPLTQPVATTAPTETPATTPAAAAGQPLPKLQSRTDTHALGQVAWQTLRWLHRNPNDPANHDGVVSPAPREETLLQLVLAANASQADGRDRLADPSFVARAFEQSRWLGDRPGYGGKVKVTRYLAYEVRGCASRTAACPTALYAAPVDDALRTRFTRAQIVAGAFEANGAAEGGAAPLVWLSTADMYRAQLQGSVVVRTEDGVQRTYNVHRVNEIPYDRSVSDPAKQGRYWFFREVDGMYGYGPEGDRILIEPRATVAGDVNAIGVGRVISLGAPDHQRLVVLADTGGAFEHNLGQLDYFAGIFPDDAAWRAATSDIPDSVDAAFVTARPQWAP